MKKTFLITGASKGIGLALANRLSAQGNAVIGIARHAVEDFPGTLHLVDLGNRDALDRFASIVRDSDVDGIINNVGLHSAGGPRKRANNEIAEGGRSHQ